jgi:hypothetical protein
LALLSFVVATLISTVSYILYFATINTSGYIKLGLVAKYKIVGYTDNKINSTTSKNIPFVWLNYI